jgi:phosphotransferase system enzyme I (PtsP)
MGIDEGLTGFAMQKGEPVMAIDALAHPRYKYFPETGEERYHSFLGVPILDKRRSLGVLVVQTSRRRRFTRDEVRLLKAVVVPVGGLLVQLGLLESLETKEEERRGYQRRMLDAVKRLQTYEKHQASPRKAQPVTAVRLNGWPAVPGFGIGRAHLLIPNVSFSSRPERRTRSPKTETSRFRQAVSRSVDELERLKERVQLSCPEIDAALFEAQGMMLKDDSFSGRVETHIQSGLSAEAALDNVVNPRRRCPLLHLLDPRPRGACGGSPRDARDDHLDPSSGLGISRRPWWFMPEGDGGARHRRVRRRGPGRRLGPAAATHVPGSP